MRSVAQLESILQRIDGRGYPAYKDIKGSWELPLPASPRTPAALWVDRVQPDPFAPPSRLRLNLTQALVGLPFWAVESPLRCRATADYLGRLFREAIDHVQRGAKGRSSRVVIDSGGAEILDRTSVRVRADEVEIRFAAGLPAAGRRILGREAQTLLLQQIPELASRSLLPGAWKEEDLRKHLHVVEDHAWLQEELPRLGLVAFLADGSLLPRASGVSQKPLKGGVPWQTPEEWAVEVDFPNAGRIRGTGIPEGITLIVGGGYHGKSTLLRALERGIYPHVPGDGRERVVTRADTWKLRAEDGRHIPRLDISAFIGDLPGGVDTQRFTTESASGSTSMAANLVEALEVGTHLLLIDEDTSASNFLVRDARMQALVPKEREPITPLLDRVRGLFRDLGVSTILVVGGAGDYLDVADRVLLMDAFHPREVTGQAREVAANLGTQRTGEAPITLQVPAGRYLDPGSIDPEHAGRTKVKAAGEDELLWGREPIDLSAVDTLVDPSQTRAIGAALLFALRRGWFAQQSARDALAAALHEAEVHGMEVWNDGDAGRDLARPRLLELASALWRLRTARVLSK